MTLSTEKINHISAAMIEFANANPAARLQQRLLAAGVTEEDLAAWLQVGMGVCQITDPVANAARNSVRDAAKGMVYPTEPSNEAVAKMVAKTARALRDQEKK